MSGDPGQCWSTATAATTIRVGRFGKAEFLKKLKVLIGVGALAAAGLAVTPVLGANAAYSDCASNRVCAWQNNHHSGDYLGSRAAGLGIANIQDASNDRTSSWANRTLTNARWFQLANGGGFCITMTNTSSNPDLADSQNDKLTSWATNRGC
ncbi:hypothetical protein GCM10023350_46430 [Nocardioides endophyticus]|uniref:Peptidase inhibitor family I36 protein n=1 Tax=Nocardioides endophyticus TaxID=1353775 RepID=A0ABP8ZGI5_9ACTN